MRPTCVEIALDALVTNYCHLEATVQRHAGKTAGLIAVVKANAYGHGLVLCARALAEAGAGWLGVTSVDEAQELLRGLRQSAGLRMRPRVLVMSGFWPGEEGAVLQAGVTPQVWEGWHFALLDAAARRAGLGAQSIPVHLEIDTGMSRQGVAPGEALAALLRSAGLGERESPVWVEGVLTHFSSPGVGSAVMEAQMDRFAAALEQLREAGVRPQVVHAGNSVNAGEGAGLERLAAMARGTGARLLVRPGLGLYGIGRDGYGADALTPVMSWKTEVTSLRDVAAGTAVGYDETFVAERAMRLALVPVGYADGLSRKLSGRLVQQGGVGQGLKGGWMVVRGQRVPVVGRVSMDQTVLDVTDAPGVALGDAVVVLGTQTGPLGTAAVGVEEHARLCGTIAYEVLCGVGARVRRVGV
jgi:alanine racemase